MPPAQQHRAVERQGQGEAGSGEEDPAAPAAVVGLAAGSGACLAGERKPQVLLCTHAGALQKQHTVCATVLLSLLVLCCR